MDILPNRVGGHVPALQKAVCHTDTTLEPLSQGYETETGELGVGLRTHWRYAEWADGGFIRTLGMDDQAISPALIVQPQRVVETTQQGELFG